MLKLVTPTIDLEFDVLEMQSEYKKNEIIFGALNLQNTSPKDYINQANINQDDITSFIVYDGNTPIGFESVRAFIDDNVKDICGHIEFSIRPSKRGLHLSKEALKLVLNYAFKVIGLETVIIIIPDEMLVACHVVESLGGIFFENNIIFGRNYQKYKIEDKDYEGGIGYFNDATATDFDHNRR